MRYDKNQKEISKSVNITYKAGLQIVIIAVCALLVGGVVLAALSLQGKQQSSQIKDGSLLEFNGMTYELIEDNETLSSLGFNRQISESDLGDELTKLDSPAVLKGGKAYRLENIDTEALLAVEKEDTIRLYRFNYFTDSNRHSGRDILNVCGSNTALIAIDATESSAKWEKTIDDKASLSQFEESFSELKPQIKTADLMENIQQSGSWDAIVTLNYENGLKFNLLIYNELKVMTGFRCVYNLPDELLKLLSEQQ